MPLFTKVLLPLFTVVFALAVTGTLLFVGGHGGSDYIETKWAFDGALGKVDRPAAQRGLQVYKEVCASCHGLKQVAYRNLTEIGFTADEVKAIAAEYEVTNDLPNDDGDMYQRKAKPFDRFVSPYANEQEARASQGGAFPPDLSLIVKARHDGANYVNSLMQGYEDAPECIDNAPHHNVYKRVYLSLTGGHEESGECVKLADGMAYNKYFGTKQIAMPAPLFEGAVEYNDGTEATVKQMSEDVTVFLQWAAEPEMEVRKFMGVGVVIFLIFFTILFYYAKKAVWKDIK